MADLSKDKDLARILADVENYFGSDSVTAAQVVSEILSRL